MFLKTVFERLPIHVTFSCQKNANRKIHQHPFSRFPTYKELYQTTNSLQFIKSKSINKTEKKNWKIIKHSYRKISQCIYYLVFVLFLFIFSRYIISIHCQTLSVNPLLCSAAAFKSSHDSISASKSQIARQFGHRKCGYERTTIVRIHL